MVIYLHGTMGYGLQNDSECDLKLQGFRYSYWFRCSTSRKSNSGCCFSLGSTVISWCSSNPNSLALSTAEAEYMDASSVSQEEVWVHNLLT